MTRRGLDGRLFPTLMVAITLVSGCALNAAKEVTEKTIDVKSGTSVHVDTRNGQIRVVEGRVGQVRIRSIKRARATTSAHKLLQQIKVIVKTSDGTLYITAEHPSGGFIKHYGVSFELTVPRATPLNLETRNGSIHLERMQGAVIARTRNGSIKAEQVAGPLQAHTRNGSIRIGSVAGNFVARTQNGSIQIRLADGLKLTGKCVAQTQNGSVRISAPKSLAANLSAETRNGSIHSDFGLAISSRKHAAGKIGAGGQPISLKTRNGSIYLRRR